MDLYERPLLAESGRWPAKLIRGRCLSKTAAEKLAPSRDKKKRKMNWDAIAAVAEVVGVIAVVVSVLYLAKQLKDSNDLSRTQTFREIMYGTANQNNVMFGPENAELVAKGFQSYKSLPPVEKLRFGHLMGNFFQFPEDSWNSANVQLLGSETMDNWAWYLGTQFFPYLGMREWWADYKSGYAPGFQAWIDNVLESTDVDSDPYGLKDT